MDPVSAISNALGAIIPGLGIGSKSRQAEIAAMGAVNFQQSQSDAAKSAAQSKTTIKILAISGILIFLILIIFLTLRKK